MLFFSFTLAGWTHTESFKDLEKLNFVKIAYGGLALGSSQILIVPMLPHKNNACFKSGQKWLENNNFATLA